MKRILVTGAGGSAAFNFITSLRLAKEKFYIVGTDVKPFFLELSDCQKKYIIPPVSSNLYLSKLNAIIKKERIDFVHPQPDPEVLFLSRNREKVAANLFLPDKQTIEYCQNKIGLIKLLESNGVPTGETYEVLSFLELKRNIKKLFLRNKKVWVRAIRGAGSKASLPVATFEQAKAWISYWKQMKGLDIDEFMISEFLPGKEFAFQSIWNRGKLITSQARERIEYIFGNLTPSGQTSSPSVAKTVWRKDVNAISTKAILAVDKNATGVFCVDLKENKKGIPCITEINAGRFFTTSNFLAAAGINMPYFYLKLAFGENPPEIKQYNPLPKNLYWIRMIDMGYKLVKNKWESKKI